ncbi:ABC transporter permease [Nitratidesulfovibrio sp. SRB-5]|uniref:ABC transporter permease n=1 Tax=Nitratidesulfovibrio sp. SRB-5 TaxID=2872636 RepID=UPI001025D136|nr:FtsX-like permease family protein [Nitratidesulfovibrio sp. SRB-5]MBZ2173048.1 FtsX-like permease family protein [Nitratidesulfovibrio sp. SRB-5]RXF76328.1 ABC transporter permease [Desulfovibrio sp. DS-1]
MLTLKFVLRNLARHPLRNALTVLGIAISIMAFGLLRTTVEAWYAGVSASAANRLVTRNAISLVFPLPIAYAGKIRAVEGVTHLSWGNWFGAYYVDEKNFFANFTVDMRSYLDLYPEYVIADDQKAALLRDRKGMAVGAKLARRFGWKLGDTVPLKGTIYPGDWNVVVRAIYTGRYPNTDETQAFFHWDYLNERMKVERPSRADHVGFYMIGVDRAENAARVAGDIDARFRNSLAETLTETEQAFQLGFISMSEAIIMAIRLVSGIVIVIIMAVAANTMAMSARERMGEFATLKALGFGGGYVALLVTGEALALSLLGGAAGCALSVPVTRVIAHVLGDYFPVFLLSGETLALQGAAAAVVGLVAGALPALRARRVRIADVLGR